MIEIWMISLAFIWFLPSFSSQSEALSETIFEKRNV